MEESLGMEHASWFPLDMPSLSPVFFPSFDPAYGSTFTEVTMASEKPDKMPKVTVNAVIGGAENLKEAFLSPKFDPLAVLPVRHFFRTCSWTKFHFREILKTYFLNASVDTTQVFHRN